MILLEIFCKISFRLCLLLYLTIRYTQGRPQRVRDPMQDLGAGLL